MTMMDATIKKMMITIMMEFSTSMTNAPLALLVGSLTHPTTVILTAAWIQTPKIAMMTMMVRMMQQMSAMLNLAF